MASRYFIYGTNCCPFCKKALDELQHNKIEHYFFNLDNDKDFLKEVTSFDNHFTVPIILENDTVTGKTKFIGGCDSLLEILHD